MHTVSILIATRNRAPFLRETLRSMEQLVLPRLTSVELILVDNGSTDDTLAVAQAFRHDEITCRILIEPRPSKSMALNRALSVAKGDVLLFTDDDVRVPPNWVEGMAGPIQRGEGDAVAGGVRLAAPLRKGWMKPFHRSLLADSEWNEAQHVRRFIGANFAASRRVFDVIAGFDPDLGPGRDSTGLHEETLLTKQVKEAGLHIARRFEVAIEHHPDPTRLNHAGFASIAVKQGRSDAYIDYHWNHVPAIPVRSRAALAACRLRLLTTYRQWPGRASEATEGMALGEIQLRRRIAYHRELIRLAGLPRNYDQEGLVKRYGTPIEVGTDREDALPDLSTVAVPDQETRPSRVTTN